MLVAAAVLKDVEDNLVGEGVTGEDKAGQDPLLHLPPSTEFLQICESGKGARRLQEEDKRGTQVKLRLNYKDEGCY